MHTFCIISTLGGYENQARAHVQGNLNVGNDKTVDVTFTEEELRDIRKKLESIEIIGERYPKEQEKLTGK